MLVLDLLHVELIHFVSAAGDASQMLERNAERTDISSGLVSSSDCCLIISAPIDRGNADLALSIFSTLRSILDSGADGGERGTSIERWKWSRPDVNTYALLIQGLETSLRISDAMRMITSVWRLGVSLNDAVPFGKVVRCPSCTVTDAVAQPQHGIQIVSCSKCRHQYELVSGTICTIESEEISIVFDVDLGIFTFLRICYCRMQHECPSMEAGAKIFANFETKHSSYCSFHCGTFVKLKTLIILKNAYVSLLLQRFSLFVEKILEFYYSCKCQRYCCLTQIISENIALHGLMNLCYCFYHDFFVENFLRSHFPLPLKCTASAVLRPLLPIPNERVSYVHLRD